MARFKHDQKKYLSLTINHHTHTYFFPIKGPTKDTGMGGTSPLDVRWQFDVTVPHDVDGV